MPFIFEKTEIKDLILIKPEVFADNRGFFMETYKKSEFYSNGIKVDFVQDNYSVSAKRVLRGLHYQIFPYEQAKLIRCTKGKIYDVALDIRPNSKSFGKYLKTELSEENKHMLFIPKGFAHGFVVLSEFAELSYKTTKEYNPTAERGILWSDKDINIDWGIDFEPVLSKKDENQPRFSDINKMEFIYD